jgi:(1->4)-alpha-D-glucan 1-alpha-D-glucosylmutase
MTLFDRHTPAATYRLQFHAGFTFDDARRVLPYLDRLGAGAVYASPVLQARAGSTHGYDIIDHDSLNTELGGEAGFDALAADLDRRGIGLLMDFVPNHMGIGQADNAWWLDVLEWGRGSPYAGYFDIDWRPAKVELHDKVLVPMLGDHYGAILTAGELRLRFDAAEGGFSVWYWDHRFPVTPPSYPRLIEAALAAGHDRIAAEEAEVLRSIKGGLQALRRKGRSLRGRQSARATGVPLKERLCALAAASPAVREALERAAATFNGPEGEHRRAPVLPLHRLLEEQNYRLSYWRVAADEINYRRFFQINDLAGLRMELPAVFDAAHGKVTELIARGAVTGLRIDHIDGLFAPRRYLREVQERMRPLIPGGAERELWVVVEKILAPHESLRDGWTVAGTTGYDFCAQVNGVLVDAAGEKPLRRLYARLTGGDDDFEALTYQTKMQAMDQELSAELHVLANELERLTEQDWDTRDFTLAVIRTALREVVACFPVYRTYVNAQGATQDDLRDIDWAVARAKRSRAVADPAVFDFLRDVLTTRFARAPGRRRHLDEIIRIARKFQQYSSPVMAKGVEDTAFYRYNLLISLNEVGGHPSHWGQTVGAFHHYNQDRARRRPFGMLTTATHDTKRGEDTRARITALSETAETWGRRVRRWRTLNRRARMEFEDGETAPTANDEYLFYQTLVGVWPPGLSPEAPPPEAVMADLTDRLVAYMLKALREAKVHTSWTVQNAAYEDAVTAFVRKVLGLSEASNPFLRDFMAFHATVAPAGALNGLAQTALKLACPGTPDIYQGCELWDDSLVDPDNRRPVDFALRDRLLADLEARTADGPTAALAADLRDAWPDGRLKMHLTRTLLGWRRSDPALFTEGAYLPLEVEGRHADNVIAFARAIRDPEAGDRWMIVAVPRCASRLAAGDHGFPLGEAWAKTRFRLPEDAPSAGWRHVLTGEAMTADGAILYLSDAFATLPLAILTEDTGP